MLNGYKSPNLLLRVKDRLVLVCQLEQYPGHPCPEQRTPVPKAWLRAEAGTLLAGVTLEPSDSHRVLRALGQPLGEKGKAE